MMHSVNFEQYTVFNCSWQLAMKQAIRDIGSLCKALDLDPATLDLSSDASSEFPLFVPRQFMVRMEQGNPHDPLLRQVLPIAAEVQSQPNFLFDPLAESDAKAAPGLLHKYPGRALLITNGACAIHCRYCFRRHYPYKSEPKSLEDWAAALSYIESDPSIEEVLLSGGDPLTLVDATLSKLAQRLASIPHLRRLRVHTRLPIVIPQRVDEELLSWLTGTRLTTSVVVHCNHPNELGEDIDDPVNAAIARLVDNGVPVLNQAVLLKGINDNEETLYQLHRKLINARVLPYYLHQLDRVQGAAHFEVPSSKGLKLIDELRKRLPGYAIPQYVEERPHELSKLPIAMFERDDCE
ncbi:MAG: EF-P beta-lysylation protein EpmB [Pirellulaceae bacterium]|jgi:EF-P beta-lysylation protein EpmB